MVQLHVLDQRDQIREKQAEVLSLVNWNCAGLDFLSRNPLAAGFLLGLEQEFYPSVLASN